MRLREQLAAYNERMNAQAAAAWHADNPPLPRTAPVPNVNDMIISKYFNVASLHAGPRVLTIRAVNFEPGGRGRDDEGKWLMYFVEERKALNLKPVILRYLEHTLGANSEGWIGRRVQLYIDPTVQMAGQVVGGVRVRVGKSDAAAAAQGLYASAAAPRFDPNTGQPLAPPPIASPGGARFDPHTGQPLSPPPPHGAGFSPDTGEIAPGAASASDPDFDDDIPF